MSAAASWRVSEKHNRRPRPAMPAIIRRDRSEEALFCAAAARIENRSRRFIHEDAVRRGEMLAHMIGDRLEMKAGALRSVAERRSIKNELWRA